MKNYIAEMWLSNQQESYRAALENKRLAIRAALILNGGAVLALLSFLGSEDDSKISNLIRHALPPFIAFAVGVLSAALTLAFAFLSQEKATHSTAAFIQGKPEAQQLEIDRRQLRNVSVALYIVSMSLFFLGCVLSMLVLYRS